MYFTSFEASSVYHSCVVVTQNNKILCIFTDMYKHPDMFSSRKITWCFKRLYISETHLVQELGNPEKV